MPRPSKRDDAPLIRIKTTSIYHAAPDNIAYLHGTFAINAGAHGLLDTKASMALGTQVAEVEYRGQIKTVRIQVAAADYEFV